MLKTLVLALSIIAVLGITFATAEDEQKIKITTTDVKGKIVAVNIEGNSMTVRDAVTGKETMYVFNDTTTFFKDGKTIVVKTLVPDETVTLKLAPDQENVIVRLDTPTIVVEEED